MGILYLFWDQSFGGRKLSTTKYGQNPYFCVCFYFILYRPITITIFKILQAHTFFLKLAFNFFYNIVLFWQTQEIVTIAIKKSGHYTYKANQFNSIMSSAAAIPGEDLFLRDYC